MYISVVLSNDSCIALNFLASASTSGREHCAWATAYLMCLRCFIHTNCTSVGKSCPFICITIRYIFQFLAAHKLPSNSPLLSYHAVHIQLFPSLDIVDSFNYLGLCFYYNGKFNFAEKQLASQGRKALFALYKNINDMYLNVETSLSLFDTYIASVLQYDSEIWGNHRGNCVEKVQLDFVSVY